MTDCLFCRIVRKEVPSFILYEDDMVLAFLDINPVSPGHTLVVPKHHSTNIFDIAPADWAAVAETTRRMAIAVEKAADADGINLAMNNREHAGQVIDHPHVHIIPRHKNDGLKLMPHRSYAHGEAESIAEKIRGALA